MIANVPGICTAEACKDGNRLFSWLSGEGKGREGEGENGEENGERRRMGRGGGEVVICHPFFVWSEYLFNFIEK